jgi:hypothetical protein
MLDRSVIHESLLTGFKPKKEDVATPYLVAADGTSLDGEIRFVGMTGKEAVTLRKSCTVGGVLDEAKFTGKLIVQCLRMRDDVSTPILDAVDGENLLDEMDTGVVDKLGTDLQAFLGLTPKPSAVPSADLTVTPSNTTTENLPGTSDLPA